MRKRVVKLLKQIYGLVDDNADSIKIDVCRKLISRVYDEDDNIKVRTRSLSFARLTRLAQDLAMDSIEDLWFSKASDATDLRTKSAVIMSVTAPLKERPSPMEETLKHVRRFLLVVAAATETTPRPGLPQAHPRRDLAHAAQALRGRGQHAHR